MNDNLIRHSSLKFNPTATLVVEGRCGALTQLILLVSDGRWSALNPTDEYDYTHLLVMRGLIL